MRLIFGIILLIIIISGIIGILLISTEEAVSQTVDNNSSFNILEVGRAGSTGYSIINYRGDSKITLLTYENPPINKVTLLNDADALSEEELDYFYNDLSIIEEYGFSFDVSDKRTLGRGIFVVPANGIPSYVLDDILFNATDSVVVLIGKSDLVLDNGLMKDDWYSSLDELQKQRIVLQNMSVYDFMESNSSLADMVLENSWADIDKQKFNITGFGKFTASIEMDSANYLRILYENGKKYGSADSVSLNPSTPITALPPSIFTWQKSVVSFDLDKTNGTAFLEIWKDDTQLDKIKLQRVTDSNYFEEPISLNSAGNYIIKITDNSGTIGGGTLHVKDLDIKYLGSSGFTYYFNVTVDSMPLRNELITISLSNSTNKKDIFVNDGLLSVPAKLEKGTNTFNFEIFGTTKSIDVSFGGEGFADIYINYGIPGLLIVIVVFFVARMSRRPVYILRVGEVIGEIRKDVKFKSLSAITAFRSIRKELGIGKNPITAHEFSLALKRHITDGADVTEGNVEEILQQLVKKGLIESYNSYYQLKGEGDIRQNALARQIRDKLIESGINFKTKGNHFITDNFEIGFFGDDFSKMALIVFEDEMQMNSLLSGMRPKEIAKMKLKEANGQISLITIERLSNVL